MRIMEIGAGRTQNTSTEEHRRRHIEARDRKRRAHSKATGNGANGEAFYVGILRDMHERIIEAADALLEHTTYGVPLSIGRKMLAEFARNPGLGEDRINEAIEATKLSLPDASKSSLVNVACYNTRRALRLAIKVARRQLTLEEATGRIEAMLAK